MVRSIIPLKTAKIGYLVISVLMAVFGIGLMFFSQQYMPIINILCGILLIIFGAIRFFGYLSKDLYRLAFQFDLPLGILFFALGGLLLIRFDHVYTLIPQGIGLLVLCDGLFKIQIALQSKSFGIEQWWLTFGFAVCVCIFGFAVLFFSEEQSIRRNVLMGLSLFFEGILNSGTALTMVKIIKNQRPDTCSR